MGRYELNGIPAGEVAGELAVGDVFLPGFRLVQWYPRGWCYRREFVVRVCDVRGVARAFARVHGAPVLVWVTRAHYAGQEARGYVVGKVRQYHGSTEGEANGDLEAIGLQLGAKTEVVR